jgi:hypothetical protein
MPAALTIAQGGTGAASLTANELVAGNGTSAVQQISNSTSGYVLTSNGTSLPSFQPSSASANVLSVYNVKDSAYSGGATGNGTTDDTPAIQAAINACGTNGGGTVFFPPGTYACASALTVAYNYVTLRGPGYGFAATLAYKSGASRTAAVIFSGASAVVQSCNMIDLTIDAGNGGALQSGSGHGVVFRVNNGTMQNVIVQYAYEDAFHLALDGAFSTTVYDVTMSNCYAQYPGQAGLYADANYDNCEFTVCKFVGGSQLETPTGTYGINSMASEQKFLNCHCYFWPDGGAAFGLSEVEQPGAITIIGGEYETNGGAGITMAGIYGFKIIGADLYANTGADITVTNSSSQGDIDGCFCTSSISQNIYLASVSDTAVHSNMLVNATNAGIKCDASSPANSQLMIYGNSITSTGTASVILDEVTHSVVFGNFVTNGIAESGGASGNLVTGNVVTGGSVTVSSSTSYAWANQGGSGALAAQLFMPESAPPSTPTGGGVLFTGNGSGGTTTGALYYLSPGGTLTKIAND